MPRRIVIIGGGIVGAALAAELSAAEHVAVTVLERGPEGRLWGSTGHAPGFVGLLGETPVMSDLAVESARIYDTLSHRGQRGFDRVGGLEIATDATASDELAGRAARAAADGLRAQVLDAEAAVALAPQIVDPARCAGGVFYEEDGTARATVITAALRQRAEERGARFLYDSPAVAIDVRAGGVVGVRSPQATFPADDVVVACGVWGPEVAAMAGQSLPLFAVEHPYVYGPAHRVPTTSATPFVRWPGRDVYARDHGDRLGLGTYDHAPRPVAVHALGDRAERPWAGDAFDRAVEEAQGLLPPHRRFIVDRYLNGVFAVTPDNRPLLGPCEDVGGVWFAEALWVTHAAGAAAALAAVMLGASRGAEDLSPLRPGRFAGRPAKELTARALRLYRDIYARGTPGA